MEINNNGTIFYIQEDCYNKNKELVGLILNSDAMGGKDERQYWFDIMPSMNDSQIDRLFNILETEKRKLEELDLKYEKQMKDIRNKYPNVFSNIENKNKKEIYETLFPN